MADGNDVEQIYDAVADALKVKNMPSCIVLNTIKGKGATFAESTGRIPHSRPRKNGMKQSLPQKPDMPLSKDRTDRRRMGMSYTLIAKHESDKRTNRDGYIPPCWS